jgi:hypothetical protein
LPAGCWPSHAQPQLRLQQRCSRDHLAVLRLTASALKTAAGQREQTPPMRGCLHPACVRPHHKHAQGPGPSSAHGSSVLSSGALCLTMQLSQLRFCCRAHCSNPFLWRASLTWSKPGTTTSRTAPSLRHVDITACTYCTWPLVSLIFPASCAAVALAMWRT